MAVCLFPGEEAEASGRVFTLGQANTLAMANSRSYQKVKNKISLQAVKYAAAVKSAWLKRKNMLTFRWTPLLSFKFPEQPDLLDSYDWEYKPLQIQTQIRTLTHELSDVKYEVKEQVSNQYVTVYILQEKTDFTADRLESIQKSIARNEVKVRTGEASQSDLDKMLQFQKKLESDFSLLSRRFETAKEKLGDLANLDVTEGYTFQNPMVQAEIPRQMLEELTQYTLKNDHGFFEAKLNAGLGLTSLQINERLMQKQYGNQMDMIRPYVNQAKAGKPIDGSAFRLSYDAFLENIDRPWQGKLRILFIKIPKEWFKGSIDGVRYVEDEPYALYTAALDYVDAKEEQDTLEKEVRENVADGFEALVTARNAYTSLKETVEEQKKDLERSSLFNQMGELSYEEWKTLQEEYEENQIGELDALAAFSQLLYSYDRLTCGGITKYLNGESLVSEAASGGNIFLEAQEEEGASYYIRPEIENNLFALGIVIPEEFGVSVTSFELWVDKVQIGERTDIGTELVHLMLDLESADQVTVRLYNGSTFADECEIDPMILSGPLKLTKGYGQAGQKAEKAVAVFSCRTDSEVGIATFTFQAKPGEAIAYYQIIEKEGSPVRTGELTPIAEPLSCLALAAGDLGRLQVRFYDAGRNLIYNGSMNGKTMEVIVTEEK